LNVAASAEIPGHQTNQHHDHAYRDSGEETKPDERIAEKKQFHAADQWGDRRVRNEAPIEVASVIERLQFISVKAIPAVGGNMENQKRKCDQNQYPQVGSKKLRDTFPQNHPLESKPGGRCVRQIGQSTRSPPRYELSLLRPCRTGALAFESGAAA
jgi:hypothetical protein